MPATHRRSIPASGTAGGSVGPTAYRYRREANLGPRCPHCAGPLVFGEGCSLCPVCGYSACST